MTASNSVALVTGANSGVGLEATRLLAASGWEVIMVCRSPERGEAARRELARDTGSGALVLETADLARLAEVEALAARVLDSRGRLHGLVLNAGLFAPRLQTTVDGFEATMAVNHLAHVLLTVRLLPALLAGSGRAVAVSSGGHRRGELRRAPLGAILDGSAWRGGLTAYGDSKLANVLFAFELDRRLRGRGVRADAVHPGVLATRIWDRARGPAGVLARIWRLFMDPPAEGGVAVTRPLLEPGLGDGGGRYFDEKEEAEPSRDARDPELAARLWSVSLAALGLDDVEI